MPAYFKKTKQAVKENHLRPAFGPGKLLAALPEQPAGPGAHLLGAQAGHLRLLVALRPGAAGGRRSRSRPAGAGRPAALPPSGCWAWTPSSPPAPSGGGPLAEMAKRFDHSLVHSLPFGHGSRPFGSSKPGQTRSCPRRSSPPRARRAGRCSLNRRERAIGRLPCSLSAQRIHPRLHRRAGSSFKTPFCLQNTRVHLWGKAHLVEANCGAELLGLAALGSAQLWPLQNVPRGPAPRRLG